MGIKMKKSSHKNSQNDSTLTTLSTDVSEKLIKGIINGTYPAGSKLPTEREMADSFGVARHIVREALKRVETLRLIKIRQGSGAEVQDYLSTGGIELVDLLLIKDDGKMDRDFLKNIIEFHTFTCIHAVKLAAQRITKEELRVLKELLDERAVNIQDPERRANITLEMSDVIVKASRNKYIQLLFNSLLRTTKAFEHIFGLPIPDDKIVQMYLERVVEALERKDQEMAALLTLRGFEENKTYLIRTIEKLYHIKSN
ncbi:MAG: GntR family transcriptional regulator [Syntrophales bacterium]